MPRRTEANRKTNIGVARAVPALLLVLIGYVSWIITKLICVDYLLNPRASLLIRPQPGGAIAILITYYFLLIILLVAFGRLLDTVVRQPGLIPRGPQWYAERSRGRKSKNPSREDRSSSRSGDEKSTDTELGDTKTPKEIRYLANESLPFRVEDFWLRDVFVCNPDGRPPYCSTCYNWKPDRSHHCSELNRCVLKFDHFCPWVGGVVSETSFKWFIQFTFYGALYTAHVLIVGAYLFAQRRAQTNFLNVHWVMLIAVAGLFFLFSGGMCMSTVQFALVNSSTIENLNRKSKVWSLAVYTPPQVLDEAHEKGIPIRLISYPRPPEEQLRMLQGSNGENGNQHIQTPQSQAASTMTGHRTFAILETPPGANPFDIGPLRNFQDIMGVTIWEWLSPTRPSPCLKHDDTTSLYKLGPVVDELKAKTGLKSWNQQTNRVRRHRSSSGRDERTGQQQRP